MIEDIPIIIPRRLKAGAMKIRLIPTRELKASDVPPIADTWFVDGPDGQDARLIEFAQSFDGYEFFGEGADDGRLGDVCNQISAAYAGHPNILKAFNTTGLRMLLFFEQRRSKWNDDRDLNPYTKAIIEVIRERLSGK